MLQLVFIRDILKQNKATSSDHYKQQCNKFMNDDFNNPAAPLKQYSILVII